MSTGSNFVDIGDVVPLTGPGVYIGVSGLASTGYVHHGPVDEEDIAIAAGSKAG